MDKCNPTKNKSNGPEAAHAEKKRKAATEPKGRMKQSRGSAEHNTKVRKAKPERNLDTGMRF